MDEILDEVDINKEGEIDWRAFKEFMINLMVVQGRIKIVEGAISKLQAKLQTYTQEEISCYAKFINTYLQNDRVLKKKLPIDPYNDEIFSKLNDGIILCKLLLILDPNCIVEGAIKTSAQMSVSDKRQNVQMALTAARSNDLPLIGIEADAFLYRTN